MIDPGLALFPVASQTDQRLFTASRPVLQAISNEMEGAVIAHRVSTRIFVGFQRLSFFLPHVQRYEALARTADGVWVLGVPDRDVPPMPGVTYVPLTEDHALTREWLLVVDAPEYFGALVAEDQSGFTVPNRLRQFQGVWSFDATLVNRLQRTLSDALGLAALERANAAPRDFRGQLGHMARLTDRLVSTLEQRNQALRELQQLREDFTRLLVHDLRNPLTTIAGALDLLESHGDRLSAERRTRYVGNAVRSVRMLNDMISGLLDVARMEEGKLSLARARLDPRQLLTAAADLARPIAEAQQKRISVEVPEDLPSVSGDGELLGRVLSNLLSNALKYTPTNGRIDLSVRARGKEVEFAVGDEGPGVPAEALGRLFQKFGQVGGSHQRAGTGLGLYFCRLVIEAHGGVIWAESAPAGGSTFRFTVPQSD